MTKSSRKVGENIHTVDYSKGEIESFQFTWGINQQEDNSSKRPFAVPLAEVGASGKGIHNYLQLRSRILNLGYSQHFPSNANIEMNVAMQISGKKTDYEYFQFINKKDIENILKGMMEQGVFNIGITAFLLRYT